MSYITTEKELIAIVFVAEKFGTWIRPLYKSNCIVFVRYCDIESHIGWRGERNTLLKSVETFP